MAKSISVASWNINSIRFRIEIVEKFLREHAPDVLCLQETKVVNELFPEGVFRQLGYNHIKLNGQQMHHGVAIVSKIPLRADMRHDWQANGEARHIGAVLPNGWRIENVYIPAGGEIPDRVESPKFGQKLDFFERMIGWSADTAAAKTPTILTGDFNVAPLESDVWSHKALINTVSHTPVEIELMRRMQEAGGWVDLGRHFVPAPDRLFTWWSYRAKDWTVGDRGRRLDHMWVTPDLLPHATAHRIHEPCRGWTKPSDHIPIVSEFTLP